MNGIEIISFLNNNIFSLEGMINSVTGALLTAIFLRHNTSTQEFEKIKAGQFKQLTEELLANGQMTYTEFYKANNFLEVAQLADKSKTTNPNSDEYDFDWFIRFYEAVGNVSDREMQFIWAKILSGEIQNPSTYSFKTIDALKNLNKKDAILFRTICNHSFSIGDSVFVPNERDYIEKCQIDYIDIMRLNELGLIHNDSTIHIDFEISEEEKVVLVNKNLALLIRSSDNKTHNVKINTYPFTVAGFELASLLEVYASDEDFIMYGQILREMRNCDVSVRRIQQIGEEMRLDSTNLLDDEK